MLLTSTNLAEGKDKIKKVNKILYTYLDALMWLEMIILIAMVVLDKSHFIIPSIIGTAVFHLLATSTMKLTYKLFKLELKQYYDTYQKKMISKK